MAPARDTRSILHFGDDLSDVPSAVLDEYIAHRERPMVRVRFTHQCLRFSIACFLLLVDYLGPIVRVNALTNVSMDSRVGPISHLSHMSMFHRILMEVIHMFFVIAIIADLVFPKTALPDSGFLASTF